MYMQYTLNLFIFYFVNYLKIHFYLIVLFIYYSILFLYCLFKLCHPALWITSYGL